MPPVWLSAIFVCWMEWLTRVLKALEVAIITIRKMAMTTMSSTSEKPLFPWSNAPRARDVLLVLVSQSTVIS